MVATTASSPSESWLALFVPFLPCGVSTCVVAYINDLGCKEDHTAFILTSCPAWAIFERQSVCSIRWLLLLCTHKDNVRSPHVSLSAYLLLLPVACLAMRPLCWMISAVICPPAPRRLEHVPKRGGLEPRWKKWGGWGWGLLAYFMFPQPCMHPEEPPGSCWPSVVPFVLCLWPCWLSQLCQFLSTVVWLPAQHQSCCSCPCVGSGGARPAMPYSNTMLTIQKQHVLLLEIRGMS